MFMHRHLSVLMMKCSYIGEWSDHFGIMNISLDTKIKKIKMDTWHNIILQLEANLNLIWALIVFNFNW